MNGVAYEFYPKLFYWDRTLWETAFIVRPVLNPMICCTQKDLLCDDEVHRHNSCNANCYDYTSSKGMRVWNIDTELPSKDHINADIDTANFGKANHYTNCI
jgi:serine/threonine protein phosphatase 1